MSVRQDKVQIVLEFINEESKSLGRHIKEAQGLNDEVKKLVQEDAKLIREFEKASAAGKSTLDIEQKRLKVQEQLKDKFAEILKTGKGLENIDLSKVAPTQLVTAAKSLEQMLAYIPKGNAQAEILAATLKKVNDQLATNRAATKGVALAIGETAYEGTKMSRIFETAFGVSLSGAIERSLEWLKEVGLEMFKRSEELEQFNRKTKTVFGEGAKEIERYAAAMSEKVGKSTNDVLDDLNDISNSFTTLEFGKKDVAGLTKQLYGLSAAWSEYNGGKYTALEVSEKFKVALGGEVDELAELGVVLTQDTLKKEMAKKGYDKLTGAAFDQASALTLLELITRKTAEAQENFGAAGESLYGKQNRIAAFLHNTWDGIARGMTTVFAGILTFGEGLTNSLKDLTPRMTQLKKETEGEQNALNVAIEKVTQYNVGTKERTQAIDTLMKLQPTFLKNLDAEKVSNEQLRDRLKEVNDQYKAKILAIAIGKKVEEAIGEEKKTYDRMAQDKVRSAQNMVDARKYLNDYTSDYSIIIQKLETGFKNSAWYSSKKAEFRDLLFNIRNYNEQAISIAKIEENASKKTATAKAEEKKIFDELKKKYPEIANDIDLIGKVAEESSTKMVNYAKGIKLKMEYDPKYLADQAKAAAKALEEAMKHEIELIKVAMERKMIVLEKDRLEGKKTAEQYQNELFGIKQDGLAKELSVYKKYKALNTLEAVKVSKDLVEIEKNKQEAILKIQLEAVDKVTEARKLAAENKFLTNTEGDTQTGVSPKKFDAEERKYKLDLLKIDEEDAVIRLNILKNAGKQESTEYIKQQNIILKIRAERRKIEQGEDEAYYKAEDAARSKWIDDQIYDLEYINAIEEEHLRERFAHVINKEGEIELARLNFKRALTAEKIALLMQGNEAEIKEARKLGLELLKIDGDINAKKIENEKRTQEIKHQLLQKGAETAKDALGVGIDLLSQDEKARKKNASAIKAFEVGKLFVNMYSEISEIWKHSEELGPWGTAIAIVKTAVATGRTFAGVQKIQAMKFAGGGFVPGVGAAPDETGQSPAGIVHANEWVANATFVKQNPELFSQLNDLQFGSNVAGLNLTPQKALYMPQYAVNNTYVNGSGANSVNNQQNQSRTDDLLVQEMRSFKNEMRTWQKELSVSFDYNKFEKFKGQLETDFSNSSF
jgi:hypothetical protein